MTSVVDETTADRQLDLGSDNPAERFLSAARRNLNAAKGRVLAGDRFEWNVDADLGEYSDGHVTRCCSLSSSERGWNGKFKLVGVASAAVSTRNGPLTSADVLAKVKEIIPYGEEHNVPRLIGLCSLDGFTRDALTSHHYDRCGLGEDISIVLVAPTQHGWAIHGVRNTDDDRVCKLFDPEGDAGREQRLLDGLRNRRVELKDGILIDDLARELGLDGQFVTEALKRKERNDPTIKLFEVNGFTFVFRGERIEKMGFLSRFGKRKGEREKQQKREALECDRAARQKRRDMVYEDIGRLEEKRADKVKAGKAASTVAKEVGRDPKKSGIVLKIIAETAELDKEIERHNELATLLSRQINIAATHIHNLTMDVLPAEEALPSDDELTDTAVAVEEMCETLKASSELADSLSPTCDEGLSDCEAEIMKEFDNTGGQIEETDKASADSDGLFEQEPETTALSEQPTRQAVDEQSDTQGRIAEAS